MPAYTLNTYRGNLKILLFTIVLLLAVFGVQAQRQTDTLSLAKQLSSKGRFKPAIKLLKPYYVSHPGNINTQWLLAQTLYNAKQFKAAKKFYEDAIAWHPENYYLRLDYAQKLLNMGEPGKAAEIAKLYLKYDSTATEAHAILAKAGYWKEDYSYATAENDKVLSKDPKNKNAKDLRKDINNARYPWLKFTAGAGFDDQPLQVVTPTVQAGLFINPYAALNFGIQAPVFIRDGNIYTAQWLQAADKIDFVKAGLSINVGAGLIRLPDNTFMPTGNLQLTQVFIKHLYLSAQVQHVPYLVTRANLDKPVMQLNYRAAIGWNEANNWQGEASFGVGHYYSEKNFVYTAAAWFLSPPVKASVFEFRFGYGYNFSTAKFNTYTADKSVNQVAANWTNQTTISGSYVPYFTPYNQSVHTAIVAINIRPIKIFEMGVNGDVGFYGTAKNPYLFLNHDAADSLIIDKGYFKKTFFPAQVNAYGAVAINDRIDLKVEYSFLSTIFYTSHYVGASLKISFWHGGKN